MTAALMANYDSGPIAEHPVVSHDEWLAARIAFLAEEKRFFRLRDDIARQRRALPWERVDKPYVFDGPSGRQTLADLFDSRRQLVVYHFMFAPEANEGCKHCFTWLSSDGSDFNYDYHVSFTPDEMKNASGVYNYAAGERGADREGASVFYRNDSGQIFHTYSTYARGIDLLNVTYNFLDLTPKGRDEDHLSDSQAWVRLHDKY